MKLFLSTPFSSKVDQHGFVLSEYRATIEQLLLSLRANQNTVFCAVEFVGWDITGGAPPDEEFQHDLNEIDAADKVVVLIEELISAGVQLELGYAYAKGKPIEMYQIGKPGYINAAFCKLPGNTAHPVASIEDFTAQVIANNQ